MAVNINIDSQVSQTITDGVTDKAPSENAVFDSLALKVDKVTGKQLSTEDYTTTEKSKLAGIAAGAEVNVNADWNATSGDAQILNKPVISSSITIGTTPITSGVAGRVLFEGSGNVVQEDAGLFWDNVNKRLGVGATPNTSTRLDVRAQGALSTDIAFRVRNSADTDNIISVKGNNSIFLLGETSNARLELTKVGNTITLLKQRVTAQIAPRFVIASYADGADSGQVQLDALFGDGSTVGFTTQRLISGVTDLVGNSLYGAFGGANATVFVMKNSIGYAGYGTIPTALPTDHFGMYSADITAGNAAPHFRTENGSVIKLYKQDLPTSPTNAELATFLSNLGLANLI